MIILPASPHLTAENLFVAPTPMMLVVITWVVLTGRPKWLDIIMVTAADVSTANPWMGSSFSILTPRVLITRHPPKAVPSPMALAQTKITQKGTSREERTPLLTRARVITPMAFWASLDPWLKAMNAADRS